MNFSHFLQKSDDLSGNINTCYDTEILGAVLFKFEPGVLFHLYCLFVCM